MGEFLVFGNTFPDSMNFLQIFIYAAWKEMLNNLPDLENQNYHGDYQKTVR